MAANTNQGPIILATRRGRNLLDSRDLFVVDFLMRDDNLHDVSVVVEASAGKVLNLTHYRIPKERTVRVSFELDDDANRVIELRMQLTAADGPPSERWLYRWTM